MSSELLECSICLEYLRDNVTHTPCNHLFHKDCLDKHLSMDFTSRCPYCRTVLQNKSNTRVWRCFSSKMDYKINVIHDGASASGVEWMFVTVYPPISSLPNLYHMNASSPYNRYFYKDNGLFINF